MSEQIDKVSSTNVRLQKATFAAGCFWGVEEAFRELRGAKFTQVGYTGGWLENPTYKQVCTDKTGHAEAVEIQFDSNEISYQDLLGKFWTIHDPTTKNRQGPDVGSQYRSVIWYHSPEQKILAIESKEKVQESLKGDGRIVFTEVLPASNFYKAEEYHQRYYEKMGGTRTCYPWRTA
jgi:peptide-methionine (S)-S-oxide reductase